MSLISGIRLFNNNGGYQTVNPALLDQTLNVPATQLSNGYSVNGQNNALSALAQDTWSLGANGTVQTNAANASNGINPNDLTQAYDPNSLSANANNVTAQYQGLYNSISASNSYDALVQQGQFNLSNLGLQVQTNGTNVTGVSIFPGANYNQLTGTPLGADAFPDQTDITTRAASKNANDVGPQSQQPIFKTNATPPTQPTATASAVQPAQPTQISSAIQPTQNVSDKVAIPKLNPFDIATNPLVQALYKAQPPAIDVSLTGPQATVTPSAAQNVAAVNAGLNVPQSSTLLDNMALLRQAFAQQSSQAKPVQNIFQNQDGHMPVAPYMPSVPTNNNAGAFASLNNAMPSMNSGADAADKKSSGGSYIPFAFTSSQSGGGNQQSNQQGRRPLMAIA